MEVEKTEISKGGPTGTWENQTWANCTDVPQAMHWIISSQLEYQNSVIKMLNLDGLCVCFLGNKCNYKVTVHEIPRV